MRDYFFAAGLFAACCAIAFGLSWALGGSWVDYLIGMVLFRVCLWEVRWGK